MLWLASSYLEHEATIQEGVYHFCLSTPSNSLWEAIEMKARSPDKLMDVTSDVKVTDENVFLSRHDDESKQQDHLLLEGRPVRILGGSSAAGFCWMSLLH